MKKQPTEKQLREQLAAIQLQEFNALVKKEFPRLKKFEGQCYKRINSYGTGRDWNIYFKVTKVKKEDMYKTANGITGYFESWSFEVTCYREVIVKKSTHGYLHSLKSSERITEEEFNHAYNKMIDALEKISK